MRRFSIKETLFGDNWLLSAGARQVFLLCAVLAIVTLPVSFGNWDPTKTASPIGRTFTVLMEIGALPIVYLWAGMWRYWSRLDNSGHRRRRIWFVVLLLGFHAGSTLYYFFEYLPQLKQRMIVNPS